MNLKCGIIGLPNVGKSTLFNVLTYSNVQSDNFLFCTINPNIGIAKVLDYRINKLKKIIKTKKIVYATVKFFDVAGLVEGASKGVGLGNRFLTDIKNTSAIFHVVRCFESTEIIHIKGKINPKEDVETINLELIFSDIENCEKLIKYLEEKKKENNKKDILKLTILKSCLLHLNNLKSLRTLNINKQEKNIVESFNFLTFKPIIYIANINKNCYKENNYFEIVKNIALSEKTEAIPICLISLINDNIELKKKKENDLSKNFFENKTLNNIIKKGYEILNLITFFTVGKKEIKAWTIIKGSNIVQAAKKIHTDFSKGFIRAKVISFKNFIHYNGELGAKEAGKLYLKGKEYIVQDGDIIQFMFNV